MIKLKDILLESLSKNKVQSIVDRVFPQIIQDRGKGRQGVPELKLHIDIYARHSNIPDMRGEESETSKAEWDYKKNTIWIYYPNMKNEEDVLRSLIHEYTHYKQDHKLFKQYKAMYSYDEDPTEIEAKRNEEDWHLFTTN